MTPDDLMRLVLGLITLLELALLPFIVRSIFQEEKTRVTGPRCRFCNVTLELKPSIANGWCAACDYERPSEELVSREQEYGLALKTFGDEYFK